ncbi:hypothetical protein ACFFVB_12630 [Formosa undariae]|uniref:Lipocalin family protein n=1 Tax=Formosa undariae TaxID=1325436 RepID=A0ABV5F3C6_9FLAO
MSIKKVILFHGIVMALLMLSSCSGNDNSEAQTDIIIGKWRAIEKYESNIQVDLPICLPHLYTEYTADKSIQGDKIITADFPEECGIILFELGWHWSNLGNNQYRIRYLEEHGQIFTFYKDGENLVEENSDGITKTIFEPY